jgi:hypothetical protein
MRLIMQHTIFPGANDVLGKPSGSTEEECGDLIIHRGYDPSWGNAPVITSAWKMSDEEKEEFLRTGVVYLRIFGHSHPPVSLSVFSPVENGWVKDSAPLQPNHPLLNTGS